MSLLRKGAISRFRPFIDYALNFDGVDDYVEVADSASLDISGEAVTLEAKIKIRSSSPAVNPFSHIIVKGGLEGPPHNYGLFIDHNFDPPRLHFGAMLDGVWKSFTGPNTGLSLNVWYYVAGSYDGSFFRLYVDGSEKDTEANSGTMDTNGESLYIGGRSGLAAGNERWFDGLKDEIRVYNEVRTLSELQSNKNARTPVLSGLVLWLPMREGTGGTVNDKSGQGNNGTLKPNYPNNAPLWVRKLP